MHTALHRNHCRLPFSLPFKAGSTASERQALEDGSRSCGGTQKEEIQAKVGSKTVAAELLLWLNWSCLPSTREVLGPIPTTVVRPVISALRKQKAGGSESLR